MSTVKYILAKIRTIDNMQSCFPYLLVYNKGSWYRTHHGAELLNFEDAKIIQQQQNSQFNPIKLVKVTL